MTIEAKPGAPRVRIFQAGGSPIFSVLEKFAY
jgi:hypothetical protein